MFYRVVLTCLLLQVLTEVMKSGDAELRLRSSDVLLSTLQHDPSPLRTFLLKQPDHTLFTLLVGSLIENSHTGSDVGVQVLEMLRLLLDPESMEQSVEKNEFLELFYDKYIDKLVQTLASGLDNELQDQQATTPATLGIIVELLCFCVQHHSYRIKYYILRNNVAEKV